MDKIRIGVIGVAKVNQQKDEIRVMLKTMDEKLKKENNVEAFVCTEPLFNEALIQDTAKKMELDERVDVLVVIVGTWVFSSHVISAVNDLSIPFVLFGESEEIANGNFGASIQIRYVLQEMGKHFLYVYGSAEDERNINKILKYANAAHTMHSIRNKKIATIGGKCMMMYQTQVNEFSWKRTFGVDFPQYDTVQVFTEMKNISDEEAQPIADDFMKKFDRIVWKCDTGECVAEDVFISQAKMFLAFKRLREMYDVEVFANKCMPEMASEIYGYKYAGCIATCLLNEAGILTACEADLPAGLSMLLLSRLSGQKVFFADIGRISKDHRRLTFFNCGTAPLSLADRNQPVEIWPNPDATADEGVVDEYMKNGTDKQRGGCVRFDLENDRLVTILRIGGNNDTLRFHVAKAITCPREVNAGEAFGERWPGFGLDFNRDIDEFLQNTVGHHYTLCFGDWTEELKYLADMYGIGYTCFDGTKKE